MNKIRLWILLVLILFSISFCTYNIGKVKAWSSREVMGSDVKYINSTKEWQDLASTYLNRRNDLINNLLQSRNFGLRKCVSTLKSLECSPLLDGDIKLFEYMSKNPDQFTNRKNTLKFEYSDIRQLTKDQVIMAAKISYVENNIPYQCNYEIEFKNINNKWYLSRYAFTN